MVLSVAVGDGPNLSLSPQPGQEDPHASRYSIPRTLPYFANFKSHTISYKEYCDIEGDYRKTKVQRQVGGSHDFLELLGSLFFQIHVVFSLFL